MTNGIVVPPSPYTQVQQTTRVQEVAAQTTEVHNLSYSDGEGNSFNLSLSRETAAYSMTYDHTAQVRTAPDAERHRGLGMPHHELRQEVKELRKEIDETVDLLRDAGFEAKDFKRLLHRMLKAVDQGYRHHYRNFDPVEEETSASVQVHAEVVAVEKKATLSMDRVDTEYWSADNTAQRLTDYATGLYAGGDREEHAEKMVAAMEQGYEEARQAFGGVLPQIADETLELAAEMIDAWAKQEPAQGEGLELVA